MINSRVLITGIRIEIQPLFVKLSIPFANSSAQHLTSSAQGMKTFLLLSLICVEAVNSQAIVQGLSNVSIPLGSQYNPNCTVTDLGSKHISMKRGTRIVGRCSSTAYQAFYYPGSVATEGTRTTCTVQINPASGTDTDKWTCDVVDPTSLTSVAQSSAQILVYDYSQLSISLTTSDASHLRWPSNVTFFCYSTDSLPPPTLRFLLDDSDITQFDTVSTATAQNNGSSTNNITISLTRSHHMKSLICRADIGFLINVKSATLQLKLVNGSTSLSAANLMLLFLSFLHLL